MLLTVTFIQAGSAFISFVSVQVLFSKSVVCRKSTFAGNFDSLNEHPNHGATYLISEDQKGRLQCIIRFDGRKADWEWNPSSATV